MRAVKKWLAEVDRQKVGRFILFLFSLVLMLLVLRTQRGYWVNIPIADEWDTPGQVLLHLKQHTLSWSDFWAQHNESRKFFPRLIYIALNGPLGWDVRYGMVLTFISAAALSWFFLQWLRGNEKSSAEALFAWCLMNAVLFGPFQYENFLNGFTFEILIPALALCGCIAMNLSDRPVGTKVLSNSILAILATYSFAHGMLLWALAVPLPAAAETKDPRWIRRWELWLLVYGLIGAIAIGCYFIGYQRPDYGPLVGFFELPLIARSVIVWLGAVVSSECVSARFAGGLIATVLFAACALSVFVVNRNRALWRRYYPWILLAGFTLAAGVLTAIGRGRLGLEALVATYRYKITAVFAYVATAGLIFQLHRDWSALRNVWRFQFVITLTIVTTLLGVAELFVFAALPPRLHAFRDSRRRARTAVIWSEALPRNPELFLAYPFPEGFPAVVSEMKRVGLIKSPMISGDLIRAISILPTNGRATAGALEGGELGQDGMLRVFGWASAPGRNIRADYVVLGWQSEADNLFHPFTVMPTGRHTSPKTDETYRVPYAGFSQEEIDISSLPRGPLTLRAWSVDLEAQQVYPIDGTVRLEARIKR